MAVQGQVIARTVSYARGMTRANRMKMYEQRGLVQPAAKKPKRTKRVDPETITEQPDGTED